jgi:hypothetical protein
MMNRDSKEDTQCVGNDLNISMWKERVLIIAHRRHVGAALIL